jgi:hypothetical protein
LPVTRNLPARTIAALISIPIRSTRRPAQIGQ